MKKITSLLLALLVVLSLAACTVQPRQEDYQSVNVRLGGLKGPTSMGMAKLLDDAENGLTANTYAFTMAASASELTPQLIKGELDILAVPANVGAILYNQTQGQVELIAASTLGVLYIVEKGGQTVTDVKSLAGKTLYATGKGATPEYALTYLLAQNGLTLGRDVTVEWKSEPSEIVALMAQEEHAIAMLPQPFVTSALSQVEGLRVALDMNEEWQKVAGSKLVTGVLVVRKDAVENDPEAFAAFMDGYKASVEAANNDVEGTAALCEQYGVVAKAALAQKALPQCNIVFETGDEMKNDLATYFNVLYAADPASVGGSLPADDFYYVG